MTKLITKLSVSFKNYLLSGTNQTKHLTCLLILLFSCMGWGQTNPTPFDLSTGSFSFTSQTATSTTYPSNMQGWATSSNNILTAETTIPSADQSLVASGTSTTSGLSNLGSNGFQFLSSSTNPNKKVGSICVALNTIGRQSVQVSWTAADQLATATKLCALDLQYRIGTSGSFTTVTGTTYSSSATSQLAAQNFTNISLPSSCENQAIVQIRWIYYEVSGSGGRDPIRLDDITVSSSSMPVCSGTPAPGNTLASVNPVASGTSTLLSLQNATTGTGVTYQWKSSTDNVTYTNISGATSATYTATPSAATYYVCDVTCSGATTTSNPVQVTLTYCTPTSSSSSTYFSGFTTSGGSTNISNNSTAFSSGGYVNYSSSMAVSQFATATINFSATIVGGTAGIAIFVDYNNDFDFIDVGETVYNSAAYQATGTTNSSFVIPSGTALGNYRMRIITDFNAGTPTSCSFASGSRGEIEDYTLTVVAQPTCMVPTALTSSAITYQTATIAWAAPTLGTSPANYEYEVRTSGAAGSGASGLVASGTITAPTASASVTGLSGATTYTYFVRSDCGDGDFSIWSNAGTFTTLSCNVPTAVTSSAITTSTATIAWTSPATGSPIGYEYEVRTSGAAGSGATGLIASGTTTAPTVSASLNALTAATNYSVYIRTNCYSGFNSSWTSAVTFATLCNSITTLPFTESFQGITTGIPTCWGIAGTLASSSSYHFSSSASGQTGRGLIFNSFNSSNGSTSELITPTLDLSTLTTAELKFYFKNPTGGNFEVLISTDNGANYTSLQSSLTGQTAWLQKTYTITSYISSTVKIKFKGTSNYGSGDAYVYLDEIIVQAIPTCFPVTALTSSAITYQTATIGWTAPTSGTSPAGYEYEVRTTGAAGSGATGLVTSGSITSPTVSANLTGLTGGTSYSYYVRSNCGGGDFSSWSSATFSTTSCSVPTAVTSSAITTTTATVSWTAPATGSLAGYEYEIRTSGAAGSGATGLVITGTTTAPTVSASLTGLTASSSYSVYVRTNCYSGFNSSWTSAVTFATLCNPISTFPYSENFDGVTTPALPNCWSVLDVNADGDKWITYTGYSQSGNNSVGLYTDYNAGANNDFLISPQFNLSGIKRLKYSVRARSSGEPNDYRVLLSTTGSSASDFSTVLLPLTSVSSTSYSQVIIDLSMYSGNVYIAFNVPSGGLDGYYIYIDDVIIEDTPNTWTGTTSNSWNTSGNWSLGTVPTSSDNIVISSNGSNAPVMDVDVTIPAGKSLTLTGGELTIAPGKVLTIAGTANFGGRPVTFKSDATGAGMFGPLTGTLTGATNVQVERFIPARRAYRFLSPSVTTSTSIRANWQENGGTTAGFGTHITGATGATAGFDPTETNNSSLLLFTNGAWVGATNTNVILLTAGNAYCLMVRGDRTTDLTSNTPTASNTVLRAKGTLFTGNFSPVLSAAASGYSFIGNPYQAPLDIKTALQASTDVNKNVVYYWDPNINARGGYITRNLQTSLNNITSSVNDYVQPGQAFFVVNEPTLTSTPALTFTENHKSVANAAAGAFRNANTNEYGTLRVNLQTNTNNQWATIDGALAIFNANFTWNVTSEDATKMANLDEEVSFVQNNTNLAIALQNNPSATSELPIKIDKMRHTNYQWQFELNNYSGATPYLLDTLNNSYTQINNGTVVPFTADLNTTNRFKIVFQNAALSNATFQNTLAIFPNPAKAGASFYVDGITEATVTVSNLLGQNVPVETKTQGDTLQVTPNTNLSQGVYLVNITTQGSTQQVKWIVE
jgi:hypothetical protein